MDCSALTDMWHAWGGSPPSWPLAAGSAAQSLCTWRGVACYYDPVPLADNSVTRPSDGSWNGRVLTLQLPLQGLTGTLPPSIGNLNVLAILCARRRPSAGDDAGPGRPAAARA